MKIFPLLLEWLESQLREVLLCLRCRARTVHLFLDREQNGDNTKCAANEAHDESVKQSDTTNKRNLRDHHPSEPKMHSSIEPLTLTPAKACQQPVGKEVANRFSRQRVLCFRSSLRRRMRRSRWYATHAARTRRVALWIMGALLDHEPYFTE